jgi:hypothetical protein
MNRDRKATRRRRWWLRWAAPRGPLARLFEAPIFIAPF